MNCTVTCVNADIKMAVWECKFLRNIEYTTELLQIKQWRDV